MVSVMMSLGVYDKHSGLLTVLHVVGNLNNLD
jgi:hypothetical protein